MKPDSQNCVDRLYPLHRATQEEIRTCLQTIVDDNRELMKLLAMGSSRPVEKVMMHLQTVRARTASLCVVSSIILQELQDPNITEEQHESFRKGLWDLHCKTRKLPPLADRELCYFPLNNVVTDPL